MSLCSKFTFIYSDCLSVIFESKEKDYLELKFLIFDSTLSENEFSKSKFSKLFSELFFGVIPLSSGEPFRYETVSQSMYLLNMIDSIEYCNMQKEWLHLRVDNDFEIDFDGFKMTARKRRIGFGSYPNPKI